MSKLGGCFSTRTKGLILSILLILSVCQLAGQQNTGTITGTVGDQQGAVIPGAAVEVKNTSTNSVFTTATNENGLYTAPGQAIGIYEISAEAKALSAACAAA